MRYALAGLTFLAAGMVFAPGAEAHGCRASDPFCGPLPRTVIVPTPHFFGHQGPVVIKPRAFHPRRSFGHEGPVIIRRPDLRHRDFFVPRHHGRQFFFQSPHPIPHRFHAPHRVPHRTMKFHRRRF